MNSREIPDKEDTERMIRNLNGHQGAKCAMFVYSERYSEQTGGCMDFWDSLNIEERDYCRLMVSSILDAKPENFKI